MEPFSYTNRCGATHYFKAVLTAKGRTRYYITKKADAEDLITEIPEGYEVLEYPYDGKVVIRKKVETLVTEAEIAIVQKAMEQFSLVNDFIISAEKGSIEVNISQFSHYFDALYPTAEETKTLFGEQVDQWKRYDWIMRFELVEQQRRVFRVTRKASVQYDAIPIDEGPELKTLAEKYCFHVGKESLIQFWILGEEDW